MILCEYIRSCFAANEIKVLTVLASYKGRVKMGFVWSKELEF